MHSSFWEFVRYPPEGYEFVLPARGWDRAIDRVARNTISVFANPRLNHLLNQLVPLRIVKPFLDARFGRPAEDIGLVFSIDHLIFHKRPWILYFIWGDALVGGASPNLPKYRAYVERWLASSYCKKIITWCDLARKSFEVNFDTSRLQHKLTVVPLAVHSRSFTKKYNPDRVRLLFLGTANNPIGSFATFTGMKYFFEFEGKGGKETLEAFRLLSERYANVELVIRSAVPPSIEREWQGFPNLRIIQQLLTREALEQELATADVLVYPTHQMTPWTGFLEAMSFELPVVTTDLYGNSEVVQDGVTGLLVKPSERVPYYGERLLVSMNTPLRKKYLEGVKTVDPRVVRDLADKIGVLVENPETRTQMGKRARWEVEHGRHSIKHRNASLKKIFDEAVTG